MDLLDDKLVIPPRRINAQGPSNDDGQAFLNLETQPARSAAPYYRPDLSLAVFQTQVNVAGSRTFQVRDLPPHPNRWKRLSQNHIDGTRQFADRANLDSSRQRQGFHRTRTKTVSPLRNRTTSISRFSSHCIICHSK